MQPTVTVNKDFDPLGSKTRWLRRCLFVLYSVLLACGLFIPAGALGSFEKIDKLLHFIAFAGFAYSTRLAFVRTSAWKIWGLIILWAPLSEALQHQLQPSRDFSWGDIYANFAGIAFGALCWRITLRLYTRWKTSP